MSSKLASILRIVAIVLLAITAAWTILSGVGTSCVAFRAEAFDSMVELVPFKPLYQFFMWGTIALGAVLAWITVSFGRGKRWAFTASLVVLALGIAMGMAHYLTSISLRGSGAPANLRVYLSALTLLFMFVLRIPAIWTHLSFGAQAGGSGTAPAGLAMSAAGLICLTAPAWVSLSHSFDGRNWAHFIDGGLALSGGLLLLGGLVILLAAGLEALPTRRVASQRIKA